jgi:hypothetical protein
VSHVRAGQGPVGAAHDHRLPRPQPPSETAQLAHAVFAVDAELASTLSNSVWLFVAAVQTSRLQLFIFRVSRGSRNGSCSGG